MLKLLEPAKRIAGPIWDQVSPRAIYWRYLQKTSPGQPLYASLGRDLTVRVYPHDVIGRAIFQYGAFEPAEVAFVERFLRPGMTFFDIGANLGQYTLIAARRVGPAGQVHSFEPSARMFGELEHNVALNRLEAVCRLNGAAVSDRRGAARLSRYPAGAEVYGSIGTQNWTEEEIVGYEEVATLTIDEYIENRRVARVDLIKMDIEGAELLALRGAHKLLERPDAPAIVLEMADVNTAGFGYAALDTWDYLSGLGYKFFEFDREGVLGGSVLRPAGFDPARNLVARK